MSEPGLSEVERTILRLESQVWRQPGAKHEVFRKAHPRVTETAYYIALTRLIDKRAALEAYPELVRRLRRLRAAPRIRGLR